MGLDFVEIIMEIEEELCVEIKDDAVQALIDRRNPPDVTPADLAALVCKLPRPAFCTKCRYDLRGHPKGHNCPECGTPFVLRDFEAACVVIRKIVANTAGVPLHKVQNDTRLFAELKIG